MVTREALVGCMLGTAVGDSIGLPFEGLSARRARRMYGTEIRQRLILGRGMISDDTEHCCLTAQALVAASDDVQRFARYLAAGLRRWLLGIPTGIGLATLRATLKLCARVPASRSGVWSAGNGPAMRAAILGAAIDDIELLRQFVRVSSRITHTDPKAEQGAMAIALAASVASRQRIVRPDSYLAAVEKALNADESRELLGLLAEVAQSVERGKSTRELAIAQGLSRGVSGYMFHTAPLAIHCWLSHQDDYRSAVTEMILCGGDTDSTAAVVGGIVGCAVGKAGVPSDWLGALWAWPHTVKWMEELAGQLHRVRVTGGATAVPSAPMYQVWPRNALFASIVLSHGFRRLLPPY